MLVNLKESIEEKALRLANFLLMLLVYMICTETSGNGVKTIGMKIIKVRQMMAVLGDRELVILKYYAAVLGTSFLISAVQRSAAALRAISVSTFSVSVLFVSTLGLHNPLPSLPFCTFALDANFIFIVHKNY